MFDDIMIEFRFKAAIPKMVIRIHVGANRHVVWLIPVDTGLPFLGRLVQRAANDGIAIRVLFLAEEPNWLEYLPATKGTV
jgi:hypothetical protein